jgi:fructosamine-3-kinase
MSLISLTRADGPLHAALAEAEIAALVAAAFGEQARVRSCRPLPGGLFNTSYELWIDHPVLHVMLRAAPTDQDALHAFERQMMRREPAIAHLMSSAGIPVPEILWIDSSRRVVPRDCIFLRYIDGVPLSHPSIPAQAKPRLFRQLGEYARRLHGIRASAFGWPMDDGIVGSGTWDVVFGGWLRAIADQSRLHDVLADDDLGRMERLLCRDAELFRQVDQPCLVHNDLWEPNVLVKETQSGWTIATIIDSDRAMFADREFEWNLWWWNYADFHAGYVIAVDPSRQATRRRQWYELTVRLLIAYVFGAQYHDRAKQDAELVPVRALLDSLTPSMTP